MSKRQIRRLCMAGLPSLFGLVLIFTLTSAVTSASRAESAVGGLIATDTTWHMANSPYIVTSDLRVAANVKLTIEAGVEVRFEADTSLLVTGTLLAYGSASQPITFTSAQLAPHPGDWRGIRIVNPGESTQTHKSGNALDVSLLQYVVLQYAGVPTENSTYVVDGFGRVEHSIFRYNSGGIRTRATGAQITDNQFYSNTISNILNLTSLDGGLILAYGDNTVIAGNQLVQNEFRFVPGDFHGVEGAMISCGNGSLITKNRIAQNQASLPFYFVGLGVNGAGSVAIENIILENAGNGLRVGQIAECNNYQASAGAAANIVQDNTGMGIYAVYAFNDEHSAIVNNQIIGNGGVGVSLLHGGNYDLSHNQIISSSGTGINLFDITGRLILNHVEGNQQGGLLIEASSPQIFFNDIINNIGYNLKNNNLFDGKHLDAKHNWWGSTESDVVAMTIIDWNENSALNVVDYEPFLMTELAHLPTVFLPLVSKNE